MKELCLATPGKAAECDLYWQVVGKEENEHVGFEARELPKLTTAEYTSRISLHDWEESPPFPLPFGNRYFESRGEERWENAINTSPQLNS